MIQNTNPFVLKIYITLIFNIYSNKHIVNA